MFFQLSTIQAPEERFKQDKIVLPENKQAF